MNQDIRDPNDIVADVLQFLRNEGLNPYQGGFLCAAALLRLAPSVHDAHGVIDHVEDWKEGGGDE